MRIKQDFYRHGSEFGVFRVGFGLAKMFSQKYCKKNIIVCLYFGFWSYEIDFTIE
jgi:hypothetical protein